MSEVKRRITMEDLYQMRWVSDPQVSPDGTQVAYVVKEVDQNDKNKYCSRIFVVAAAGGQPVQYTNGPKNDANPRWSPDGKYLAFTSNRAENNQIWVMATCGGEARQVTSGKTSAGTPVWSPDGSKIAFVSKVASSTEASKEEQSDVKVITRLHYKQNGEGFLGDKRSQIFVVDVASGKQQQVTSGDFDCGSPTWSPCSQYLAFSSNRTEDSDYNNQTDVWVVEADGGELRKLSPGTGPAGNPSWSPDGKLIAYLGHEREYGSATLARIMVANVDTQEVRNLTADFDRTPGNACGSDMVGSPDPGLVWSADGKNIYFLATDGASTKLFSTDVQTAQVCPVFEPGEQVVYGMSYSKQSDSFALTITSPGKIGDVYSYKAGDAPKQLTEVNKDLLGQIELSMPEQFSVVSDGMDVECWVIKPIGFKAGVKYPAVIEIHGGPHVAYGNTFMHEFQLLAAAGYAVIYTNPPGSQGYGQEFVSKTHHDWGGADYRAIMAAVDAACQFDFIDQDRLGVTGGSYGGYMTNWMIGHTDLFKAAVTQRSTCNRYSQFGTSDVGFFNGEYEFMGNPWENPEFYLERSPITYVKNVNTPLLLIHSEQDLRCPIEQAEQFYTALKWLRKEAVFVRFPDENHELSRSGKPKHRVERLKHILGWFKKYIECTTEEYTH